MLLYPATGGIMEKSRQKEAQNRLASHAALLLTHLM
jgi:hypothetical protein